MVPAADIRKRSLDARIRLDQPRYLLQAPPELGWWILRAVGRSVWTLVDGFDHFHRFKRFFSGRHEFRIGRRGVHALENAGSVLIAHLKLFEIIDSHSSLIAPQSARQLRAH